MCAIEELIIIIYYYYLSCHQPRMTRDVVDTHVLAADEPPRLTYTSVLNIYLYI